MAFELIYTSAPQGLRAGTRGFCTVAHTEGMPSALIQLAESLSGYRHLYQPHDPLHARNPVAFSHYTLSSGGEELSVLSRVAASGTDYSGRTNKLAHHVILTARERVEGGPAALMSVPGFFVTEWSGEPRVLPARVVPALPAAATFLAGSWASVCGDAGWAGVLAGSCGEGASEDVHLVFQPSQPLLPLIEEALRLLPPAERWKLTFSTHFTAAPTGSTCRWRCCSADSEEHRAALGRRRGLIVDLSKPLGPAPDGPLVECARSGAQPGWMRKPAPRAPVQPAPAVARAAAASTPRPAPAAAPAKREPAASHGRKPKMTIARHSADGRIPGAGARRSGVPAAAIGFVVALVVLGVAVMVAKGRRPSAEPVRQPVPVPPPAASNAAAPLHVDTEPPREIETHPPVLPTQSVAAVTESPPVATAVTVRVAAPVLVSRVRGSGAVAPLSIELPSAIDWRSSAFAFMGLDGELSVPEPRRDMDRLENRARRIIYTLPSGGWTATVQEGSVRFDPPPGATPAAGHGVVCIRVKPAAGGSETLLWIAPLTVTGFVESQAAEDGVVVTATADGTLSLLATALGSGACACMAVYEKAGARVAVPYELSCAEGQLRLAVRLQAVSEEIARQQKIAALESKGGVGGRAAAVDYARMKALLEKIRKSATDSNGTMSTARRMNACRDLKVLLVDEGESRLIKLPEDGADATHLDAALERVRAKVSDMLTVESKSRHRTLDRSEATEDRRPLKDRSGARAAYFKTTVLAGNQALTSDMLLALIESDELQALVEPPAAGEGTDAGAEKAGAASEKKVGPPLPDRFEFLTGEGSKDSVLNVRAVAGRAP